MATGKAFVNWNFRLWASALLLTNGIFAQSTGTRPRTHELPPMARNARTGPAVGVKIPAVAGVDQDGKLRTFNDLKGSKGLVLVFARSADWCPYCKTQLVDLNSQVDQFKAQGLTVAALTYDSPAVLADFAKRQGIRFPLLSDTGSKVIRAFGILNTNIAPKTPQYGIPFPGTYIVDAEGRVKSKYFEEDYRERYSAAAIVSKEFGEDGGERSIIDSSQAWVITGSSDAKIHPGKRLTLTLEVDPKEKMHLYAPGVKGYMAVEWEMADSKLVSATPPVFPASKMLNLPAINETVPVYEKRFKVTRDIVIGQESELSLGADRKLTIEGTLKYQACDDRQCYIPKTIPLKWTFPVAQLDTTRPAPALQRKLN
jgi:peroxiredoxin